MNVPSRLYLWILPLLMVGLVAVFACNGDGQGGSSTPGAGSPGPDETQTAGTSTPGADGSPETPSPEPEIPEGVLEDVPQFANSELVSAGEEDNQLSAEFRTSSSPDAVVDFYRDAMSEDPWLLVTELVPDESTTLIVFSRLADPDVNGTVAIQSVAGDETAIVVEISIGSLTPTPLDQ